MFLRTLSKTALLRVAPLALVATTLLSGCSNMFTTAKSGAPLALSTMSGTMHGGNQAIVGATVNLYAAGTTGYGSAGTLLATMQSGAGGSFGFTQVATQPAALGTSYACPSSASEIYIIGTGGNTLNGFGTSTNTASSLIAAVGTCGQAGSVTLNINEITTVATVAALQQYMNPGTTTPGTATIGTSVDYTVASPGQAGTGLINAFAAVPNLVTLATGAAVTSFTKTNTPTSVASVTVTATPESAKLNTIADILAACINQATSAPSDGAGCTTLFANAVPPSPAVTSQPSATFNTAVDTLQAAYYMQTNPTDTNATNLGNLYTLPSGQSPFQPTLSVQPSDWTIGIVYSSGATTCASGALFINYGYGTSVDASGNIWMANGGSSTRGALTEMSPLGVPLACSTTIAGSRGGAAIDTAGNVWMASNQAAFIYKFDGTNTTAIPVPNSGKTYSVVADGSGNVFFTDATNSLIYELPSTATATSTPTKISTSGTATPTSLAFDNNKTLWVAPNAGTAIYVLPPVNPGGSTYPATIQTVTNSTNYTSVYGVAVDASGNVWTSNSANGNVSPGNTISYSTPTTDGMSPQTVTVAASTPSTPNAGGLQTPRQIAIDGAGNVWTADNNTNGNSGNANATLATFIYGISEFTKTGVALSPTVTNGTTQTGGYLKSTAYFNGPRAIAIDPSGNVWITQATSTASTIMTEVVGSAVPVVTPISAQVKNNTFASKP